MIEPSFLGPDTGYEVTAVRQEMRRREELITSLAVERLPAIGIVTEVLIMRGNAEELIGFDSRQWATDLILNQPHNRADLGNLMRGSVARSVVESAPCPVEVIRVTRDGWVLCFINCVTVCRPYELAG